MVDRAGNSVTGGAIRGAIAGAAGVWALHELDKYLLAKESRAVRDATTAARPGGMDPAHVIADRAARSVGVHMAEPLHSAAGTAVKYALGIVPGMLYGILRDRLGFLDAARGAAFGVAYWAIEDEYGARAAGLAGPPTEYPWQVHGRGFLAHLAYGLTLDAVLRVLKGPPA